MKIIPEFPNYCISNTGIVTGKTIKAQTHGKNGYKYVTLYSNNIQKKLYVHRLMAQLYIDNPKNKRTVNHKDGNKHNNCLTNLEWNTDKENIQHAYNTGINKGSSEVTEENKADMYAKFMKGNNLTVISKDYPFNNVTVSNHIRKYVKANNLSKEYETEKVKQKLLRQCR